MRTRILVCGLVIGLSRDPAAAGRHVVGRGETLERVAQVYGCSVEAVLRANHLNTTLVPAGTVVEIPRCDLRARARVRDDGDRARPRTRTPGDDRARPRTLDDAGDRARRALAVIDLDAVGEGSVVVAAPRGPSRSVGEPWAGGLRGGERLATGDGYQVRRPQHAFGASHVVDHLRGAIATVRALYPEVHTLAIGDLSAQGGGKLADHRSHQSGLDVDVGFYFHAVPPGYPGQFVAANHELDLEATWALIVAFARTTHLDDGVQVIFLDQDIQERLHRWARQRGTPDDQLAELLQYPRDKDTPAGLVRHWPHHADHMHVRFKRP